MNSTTEEIGGIKYLNKNASLYLPYTIMYLIGVLIGCTGKIISINFRRF